MLSQEFAKRSPQGCINKPFKALFFDSWYDDYVGMICLVAVIDGQVKKGKNSFSQLQFSGDKIRCIHSDLNFEVNDVGIMYPTRQSTSIL